MMTQPNKLIQIEAYRDEEAILFRLIGRLMLQDVRWVGETIEPLLHGPFKKCYFDLRELEHVDSSGLALFIRINAEMFKQGNTMILLGATYRVLRVFNVAKIESVIKMISSESADEIVAALHTPEKAYVLESPVPTPDSDEAATA